VPENNDDWYDTVEDGGKLLQGDLLAGCPILRPSPDIPFPLPEDGNLPATVENQNVVVLTQSCDLEQNKVDGVVCCIHFDLEQAKEQNPLLSKKQTLEEIKKGRHARYTLLAARDAEPKLSLRIVDLGDIFVLPKAYLEKVAAAQNPRLRLRVPYREHLSQAVGRFYMRVALPRDPL
jgi:hypothetical protein